MVNEDVDSVWIKSEPDENGRYHVYMETGPDQSIPLDADAAYGWAREVLSAVAQAEHDAAVIKQLRRVGTDVDSAAHLVADMRQDRAEHIPISVLPGFAIKPGVTREAKAFLVIQRNGEPIGQWDMDDARAHALNVLEAIEVAPLDSAYVRILTSKVGISHEVAQTMVHALADER